MDHKAEVKFLYPLLALQAICATFFTWDGVVDLIYGPDYRGWADPESLEFLVAIALVASLAFTLMRIRQLSERQKRMADQLKIASGLFSELLEEHFTQWGLSASESDVALLAVKGMSITEIANIRGSRDGTIKAQLNAVYKKAGVSNRNQLLSLFIEELMDDRLTAMGSR